MYIEIHCNNYMYIAIIYYCYFFVYWRPLNGPILTSFMYRDFPPPPPPTSTTVPIVEFAAVTSEAHCWRRSWILPLNSLSCSGDKW